MKWIFCFDGRSGLGCRVPAKNEILSRAILQAPSVPYKIRPRVLCRASANFKFPPKALSQKFYRSEALLALYFEKEKKGTVT